MKHCRACDVDVATPAVLCPLCGTPLAGLADADCAAVYPPAGSRKEYNFVKRLLLLLSVVGAAVCIVVNLLVMPSFWWWTIVVTALVYAWAVVPHAMRRGGNAAGKVLMQVVAGSALAVLVDFETGYRGWGVSFVVPAFICAGIVAVVVLVICNRTNWAGYVLYQAVLAVFGLAVLHRAGAQPGGRRGAQHPGGGHIGRHGRVRRPDDQKRIPPAAAFLTMGSLLRQPPP